MIAVTGMDKWMDGWMEGKKEGQKERQTAFLVFGGAPPFHSTRAFG